MGNYIVDFFCTSCMVVVEIDGKSHDNKQEYDERRNKYLRSLELTIIHIRTKEVMQKLPDVMTWLHGHPAFDVDSGKTIPSA